MLILTVVVATALPPIMKDGGSCPPHYSSAGSYCVPQRDAGIAVPKVGPCPPNMSSAGRYCVGRPQR